MDRAKKNLLNVLSLVCLMVVVFLAIGFSVLFSWKGSFVPARTITVSAQGMTVATPDEADIDFSVVTQGADPTSLSNNNNMKMGAVMQFVSSQGVASSDVQTTGYDLEPNYQFDKNSDRNDIIGYTLTQTVQVKIRDLTKVASVLGGLAPLGVNQIGGVNFTFQNPDEFVAIARGQALTNAQTEASQMAAQAGASLGQAVTITESSNVPSPLPVYAMSAGEGAMAAPITPSIAPGTENVSDEVTVTYELN